MLNCTASVLGINGFPLPLKDFVTCSIYCDRHPSGACALRNPEDCTFLCSGKVDRSRALSFIVFLLLIMEDYKLYLKVLLGTFLSAL